MRLNLYLKGKLIVRLLPLLPKNIIYPDPADIPSKYGLARPFLSIPCKSAPDIPRDEPTNKDANNLGNLSSQIIV